MRRGKEPKRGGGGKGMDKKSKKVNFEGERERE